MTNLSPLLSWQSLLWWFSLLFLSVFPLALMGSTRTLKNKRLFKKYIKERGTSEKVFATPNSFLNYLSAAAANCLLRAVQPGV